MAEILKRDDLMSLEQYAGQRGEFRARVIAHKKYRRVSIGQYLHLYFEDRLTIQYQVQEMLRIEKIFEADGIEEELEAYNPLIPDGTNLKAQRYRGPGVDTGGGIRPYLCHRKRGSGTQQCGENLGCSLHAF
jgi:hypothetical protein